MKQLQKAFAVVLAAALILALWTLPAEGVRRYDACAEDYKSFSELTQDIPADISLIVKTDGTLPDFRATHPVQTVQGPDDTYVVRYANEAAADEALIYMEAQSGVDWAEINVPVHAQAQTVSDAGIVHDWGVRYIGADVLNAQLRKTDLSERITVAVIDSGIYPSHPIFKDRNITGTSMMGEAYDRDGSGHGTAVTGIIADCTEGLPVDFLEVRILDGDGNGTSANAASGIRYAADNGAAVLNLSFAAENHVQVLDDAVAYALDRGCLPVISAGNFKKNLDSDSVCPSHSGKGVIVSGCAEDDELYKKTCYGSVIDVCAPAVNISCANLGGGYTTKTGTSFSAPYASAAAAMLKLLAPSADVRMLEYLLKKNSRDLGNAGFDEFYGFGVIDLQSVRLPEYTLKLDAAGGTFASGTSVAQTLSAGAHPAKHPEPGRDGFTFAGYLPAIPASMSFGDLTCTAIWLPDTAADVTIVEREDPTCANSGCVKYTVGSELYMQTVPALGHSFTDWQLRRPATQYSSGEEVSFCTRCDKTLTRPIEKLPSVPLTLKETNLRLRYKKSFDLAPSEAVTWSVDNNSVVSVSPSGVVEAVGRGNATVTATSLDGMKTAECKVTVYCTLWQWLIIIILGGWFWY